ncbi:putative short chain dehydrogenase [Schistosoma mansoni]|uniref:Putative short chain dehydrogenase n=1 Tax=Schistosoma mansoni TaxID=6183 RepID=G4VSH5_SCHMA|nr:putative short chain dehydrogenase [Schistosoma mansoni]|eukprot:XP_018655465.1 putative short chain dehydrogenase [Schistosoma mansoni]
MSETIGIWHKACCISKRLDGKLAIVTGSNTGIGLVTASELARRGARVIMACRNLRKAEDAKRRLLEKYGANNPQSVNIDVACEQVISSLSPINSDQLIIEQLDLASLQSIREFARRIIVTYPELHFLINNAGLAVSKYEKTADGFEMTMGVNHFGTFLLTELLLPLIKRSTPSRIVILSSVSHYRGRLIKPDLQVQPKEYNEAKVYCSSKLANVMHAVELSERLKDSGITVVSVHPGAVKTEIFRDVKDFSLKCIIAVKWLTFISPWKGAQTTLYTVLSDNLISGGYYSNCALKEPSTIVKNKDERKWFWSKTCELLRIENTT